MQIISDERRKALLLWTGVKLAKDGKSVFNYNPGIFQSGANFILANMLLPPFLNRAHYMQLLMLYVLLDVYWLGLSNAEGAVVLNSQIVWCYENIASMSRFVLGLFVSMVISKTYYSNRGVFGTVFGCSMGLTQMTVSWVRPPPALAGDAAATASAKSARLLIIRWVNAAFRLMWLETQPGKSAGEIGKELVGKDLLTQKEWGKIEGLSSRCTHIYQWLNNVLEELFRKGYILSAQQLVQMNTQVDNMRGANVWGLPSLPIAYTQIITHMVKMHVMMLALNNAVLCRVRVDEAQASGGTSSMLVLSLVIIHGDLAFHHYLFQGLLDLHGALYNPNAGLFLGHMPALNFMEFVYDVTNKMESENEEKPYVLELVSADVPCKPVLSAS
mmetsp:Transcript_30799/g.102577  ORF Transcript_30799/g.102577 Transcript_30799/m.102577 type:complete len:386 (+) Transcript_30799:60-1217(+)|eukprot:CAMPEP_0204133564 /NCGR_PEP_ID=MMETSP0361-20130328/15169_1 /ASSEMBLY_ACC=CAM_ASM_000343 /TAXON_ID=268821 /ORGANISM="Scrippsiella Hangoei, Strain SHTV-5" /LENGTH=385 /DNA_ID=CAMNT_0051086631 /DNA_START=58 /DNA_END=1215 /DNA_ORIENTATION=+